MEDATLLNQVILQFQDKFQPFYEDLSAALLTSNGHLWVGSDETTTIERLSFDGDRTFSDHQIIEIGELIDLPAGKDEEIDIEGFACTDNYLWFVGSHSPKRKKPKPDKTDKKNAERLATVKSENNRYILARLPLVNGQLHQSCPHPDDPKQNLTAAYLKLTEKGNVLTDALASDPHLSPFIISGIPSKDNGLDIEGMAICNGRILLGLRGPVLRGWAIILEVEVEATSSTVLELKNLEADNKFYKKHFVNLDGLGIRDLCLDGQDLLILAGPTMDIDGPVKLFRLEGGLHSEDNTFAWEPMPILDLPYGDGNHHGEGVTLFNSIAQQPSVLVVYDSPSEDAKVDDAIAVFADIFPL